MTVVARVRGRWHSLDTISHVGYTEGMSKDIESQLKHAATHSGLSMYALSKQSGVPYSAMHGFCTGDRRLSLRSAAKLAAVLKLELQSIRLKKRKGG